LPKWDISKTNWHVSDSKNADFFRRVKEIEDLCGGEVLYAAQTKPKIDAEIAEKERFRAETKLIPKTPLPPSSAAPHQYPAAPRYRSST